MEITLFTFSFLLCIYFMWIDIILSALQLKLDDKRPRINVAFYWAQAIVHRVPVHISSQGPYKACYWRMHEAPAYRHCVALPPTRERPQIPTISQMSSLNRHDMVRPSAFSPPHPPLVENLHSSITSNYYYFIDVEYV